MFRESIIDLPNGMQVVTWKENSEVYMGVVNENGYVVTDRRLTVSEADKLSVTSHCP